MEFPDGEIARVGAVAGALVGVGAVLRWAWKQACRFLGWERMAELEHGLSPAAGKLTALDKKIDAVREETLAVAGDTNERVARIEGQLETLLALLEGNKTRLERLLHDARRAM